MNKKRGEEKGREEEYCILLFDVVGFANFISFHAQSSPGRHYINHKVTKPMRN